MVADKGEKTLRLYGDYRDHKAEDTGLQKVLFQYYFQIRCSNGVSSCNSGLRISETFYILVA